MKNNAKLIYFVCSSKLIISTCFANELHLLKTCVQKYVFTSQVFAFPSSKNEKSRHFNEKNGGGRGAGPGGGQDSAGGCTQM